jgi:hypothetical protein
MSTEYNNILWSWQNTKMKAGSMKGVDLLIFILLPFIRQIDPWLGAGWTKESEITVSWSAPIMTITKLNARQQIPILTRYAHEFLVASLGLYEFISMMEGGELTGTLSGKEGLVKR